MSLMLRVTEQRAHPRLVCQLTGSLREMESARVSETLDEFRHKNHLVTLQNLSLGGTRIETDLPLQPGHVIRLEFGLSTHGMLATFVEVCWAKGKQAGVRFLALPDKGVQNLRQFLLRENIVQNGSRSQQKG
jgi:hypothetical protein